MKKTSLFAYYLCCSLMVATALWHPKWSMTETHATISWDIMGYYLYLPAIFIYHDIKEVRFKDDIMQKYTPSGSYYQSFAHDSGSQVMKYPLGLALCYLPFFLMAHLMAGILGYPADGFSLPYQAAIHWGSIMWAFFGLWMLRKVLLLYFEDMIAAIVLMLTIAGSHALLYSGIDAPYAHFFGFGLYAVILYLTDRWYKSPAWGVSLLLGAAIGLVALIRPTDIICVMIPFLWGIDGWSSLKKRFSVWYRHFLLLIAAAAMTLLMGSLQLIYWKYTTGEWLIYSYKEQGFNFWKPHITECLFSYKKGWLVYTPVMLLSILGLVPLFLKYRKTFLAVLMILLIHAWITFSWDIWWYGGGFGQRAMIQIYPVLALPMAALVQQAWRFQVTKYLLSAFGIACIWFNMMVIWQSHAPNGGFDTEYMNKAYFWKIFGKTHVPEEWSVLIDQDEPFIEGEKHLQVAYTNDFEKEISRADTIYSHSGNYSMGVSLSNPFSPEWLIPLPNNRPRGIRIDAWFFAEWKQWEVWRMPQLTVVFENNGVVIKQNMMRVSRFLGEKDWKKIGFEVRTPAQPYDKIKVYLWSADSDKPVWMDDLEVSFLD